VTPADWLDEVRRVVDHVRTSDATEVEVASPGFRLRLVRRLDGTVVVGAGGPATGAPAGAAAADAPSDLATIVAPLTGVFYRSPSPDVRAYVEVDDHVEQDSVVGLIETMKIFNEIVAERTGRIAAILAETGQLVHAGETLMTVDVAASPGDRQAAS
jgi:acetyl-CoA carboxylase biotin carboxyl carrier protein